MQGTFGYRRQDGLADDAISIKSFETILPSYSEATLPSYTPLPTDTPTPSTSRPTRITRLPPVPQSSQQVLSISQSNLPLRFNGPKSTQSHPWSPKIVYPTPSGKKRLGAELNNFFRNARPATEPLGHGDMSEVRRTPPRRTFLPHTNSGRSYEEEAHMRELDERTREISRRACTQSTSSPRALPQIVGSLRRESRILGEEWDNLAVEAQREEILMRISELESRFRERTQLNDPTTALRDDIASLQTILATRKDDVSSVLASQVQRIRELKHSGARVSHLQKAQIKTDTLSMKAEITFLEQRAVDLERFARQVEDDDRRRGIAANPLEDDSKTWDLWFEANGSR
jgi:hypothetical protein